MLARTTDSVFHEAGGYLSAINVEVEVAAGKGWLEWYGSL
jgi:hypothetical protein